ncbi:uncharacterized protein CANTADRAFT_34018, partial [Suhomyces tanzawaensis NRRL Y-17324]
EKPKTFTIKYKRPRGSRACTVCRSRKVRCDAEIHIPCTNCITFGCDCVLPEAKKRSNPSQDLRPKRKQTLPVTKKERSRGADSEGESDLREHLTTKSDDTSNETILNISQISLPPSLTSSYKSRPTMHKKEMLNSKSPTAALTFLGSSSIGAIAQKVDENHVQLTADVFDFGDDALDSVELEILKLRGAFLLPSHDLALDIINSYFEHVHPLMPVINRTEFMRKFEDPDDNPSLMLLQSVLLCGSRVSKNPLLMDHNNSTMLASLTFFRRAKALYEASYESDPVSVLQTLLLVGSFWEGPEDVTKNSYYWTKVAIALAQGYGFQRDISNSKTLSNSDKKIWRRVWWCLFEKDRNVAIAFGRPAAIDLNDCDVPMLTLEDFDENDNELGIKSPYPVNETQALYFIHLVKLAEITGIIIKHQYSVKSEQLKRKNKFSIIQHCDMLMGIWFTNLPPQLVFSVNDTSNQNFYCCLLNAQYYNRLYLIHRSNLIRMAKSSSTNPNNYRYPSWGISFQAARMISMVSKILYERDQVKYCPVMFVYILFSALMMLIYHVDSANQVVAVTASDSLFVTKNVLRELAKYWPVARVLNKLFDKYANDKIKRAKVIENGTKIAEYQELNANIKAMKRENSINDYYTEKNNNNPTNNQTGRSPSASVTSGISPGGALYDYSKQQITSSNQPSAQNPTSDQANFEELVQKFKQPKKHHVEYHEMLDTTASKISDDTSPTSSAHSFPDISLVTETMPANSNFFENFEPTQLFPEHRTSAPPTRAQSPQIVTDTSMGDPLNGNEYSNGQQDQFMGGENPYPPTTPGGTLNTNFIDSSFINMNLQSGFDSSYFGDDVGSMFSMPH